MIGGHPGRNDKAVDVGRAFAPQMRLCELDRAEAGPDEACAHVGLGMAVAAVRVKAVTLRRRGFLGLVLEREEERSAGARYSSRWIRTSSKLSAKPSNTAATNASPARSGTPSLVQAASMCLATGLSGSTPSHAR